MEIDLICDCRLDPIVHIFHFEQVRRTLILLYFNSGLARPQKLNIDLCKLRLQMTVQEKVKQTWSKADQVLTMNIETNLIYSFKIIFLLLIIPEQVDLII